jgi:hypothetical protein
MAGDRSDWFESDEVVLEMIRERKPDFADPRSMPRLSDLVGGVRVATGRDLTAEEAQAVRAELEVILPRLIRSGRLRRVQLRDWRDQGGPDWGYFLPKVEKGGG